MCKWIILDEEGRDNFKGNFGDFPRFYFKNLHKIIFLCKILRMIIIVLWVPIFKNIINSKNKTKVNNII